MVKAEWSMPVLPKAVDREAILIYVVFPVTMLFTRHILRAGIDHLPFTF